MQIQVYSPDTKTCRDCQKIRPLSDFYTFLRRGIRQPLSYCKPCHNKRTEKTQGKRRDTIARQVSARRRAARSHIGTDQQRVASFRNFRDGSRKRATKYGVVYEEVDFAAVLKRDAWTCQICLLVVMPADLSFDHAIPMSRGGPHTFDNVRVAHRVCNSAKGQRLPSSAISNRVQCPNCHHEFPLKRKAALALTGSAASSP